MFGTVANTALAATVEESMAKPGEISGARKSGERTYKHAATVDQVRQARERVESLGWDWHDAAADAGISRNVGYTLLRGEGSIGSLRRIEEWLSKKEGQQAQQRARNPQEVWQELKAELEALGPDQLDVTIEGLQEYIRAEKRRRAAFQKILRVTPEPKR